MARIRSLHPGFWTDENMVTLSPYARLLFLALGNEADDKGTFEWKPTTLKMRIFPAENLDMQAVLAELESVDAIKTYEIDSRKYGAIRNFRKFQRPKSPNDVHPATDEIRNYVGLTQSISEVPDAEPIPFPQKGEIGFQMEEVGGRRKEGKKDQGASAPSEPISLDVEFYRKGKLLLGNSAGGLLSRAKEKLGLDRAMGLLLESEGKADAKEYFAAAITKSREPPDERRATWN